MKPRTLLMYIVDDYIILWDNTKIYKEKISKQAAYYGKVYNQVEFIKNVDKILKKLKLNKGLINNNVTVVTDPNHTPTDIEILKNCLEKLSFNKIKFINITKLYKLKRNNIFITFNKYYLYLTYFNYKHKTESIFIDYKLFSNSIKVLSQYLSTLIKNKNPIITGNNQQLELLAQTLEQISKLKVYYIDDFILYIINEIKSTSY